MSQQLNQKAAEYLRAYRGGALPQDRIAFGTALRQIALDDTPEGLDRITALLDQLREKVRPVFQDFARDEACVNFALLLAFHLGERIARAAATRIDWLDHDEALPLLPAGAPRKFATLVVGVVGPQRLPCLPLRTIRDRLFGEQPTIGCREYVEQTVRQLHQQAPHRPAPAPAPRPMPPRIETVAAPAEAEEEAAPLIPIRRVDTVPPPAPPRGVLGKLGTLRGGRTAWFETADQAGHLAASAMQVLAGGGAFTPALLKANGRLRRDIALENLTPGQLQGAAEQLLENPHHHDFLVLLHAGEAQLPDGPAAALLLECRSYRGEELHLQMALPYRPAQQPGGFAIFCPRLMHCSAPHQVQPEVFGAFYAGADRQGASGKSWDQYLDERL